MRPEDRAEVGGHVDLGHDGHVVAAGEREDLADLRLAQRLAARRSPDGRAARTPQRWSSVRCRCRRLSFKYASSRMCDSIQRLRVDAPAEIDHQAALGVARPVERAAARDRVALAQELEQACASRRTRPLRCARGCRSCGRCGADNPRGRGGDRGRGGGGGYRRGGASAARTAVARAPAGPSAGGGPPPGRAPSSEAAGSSAAARPRGSTSAAGTSPRRRPSTPAARGSSWAAGWPPRQKPEREAQGPPERRSAGSRQARAGRRLRGAQAPVPKRTAARAALRVNCPGPFTPNSG